MAIKLLHAGHRGRSQLRLLREAQALARLAHPNVVAIHEVGTVGERVYLAMELVQGKTLAAALADDAGASWRERVALLLQAGRGLAAAHAAGLVHRDVKPSNVLVGDDGRVRVVDFGLASVGPDEHGAAPASEEGPLIGTPGYMAPEQLENGQADARSDQFCFCIVLYRAVYGQHPFAGDSMMELITAVLAGEVRPPPAHSEAPAWLRRAILRGLSTAPERRFPSMDALLAELERGLAPRSGRWIGAGLLALAISAGLVAAALRGQAGGECGSGDAELRGVWDAGRKQAVAAAMRGSGQAYAVDAWTRVEARLDAWAGRWRVAWQVACDGQAASEQAPREEQRACLLRHVRTLRSLTSALAAGDEPTLERAVAAAQALPDPSVCREPAGLRPRPADPELRARFDAGEAALADARQNALLGRTVAAHESLAAGEAAATELGDAWLKATAGLVRGQLARRAGDVVAAGRHLTDAYFLAAETDDHALTAALATLLVRVIGAELRRVEEAAQWERHARVALERLADPTAAELALALARAEVLLAAGRTGEAEDALTPVLRAATKASGLTAAEVLLQLGDVRTTDAAFARAAEDYRDAEGWYAATLGPQHPDVGHARFGMARLAAARGDLGAARRGFEALLSFWTDTLGPGHPSVAAVHYALAQLLTNGGEADRAAAHYARARGIFGDAYGAEHVRTALAACGLAMRHVGRDDAAYASESEAAGAVLRRPGHPRDRCALVLPHARAGLIPGADARAHAARVAAALPAPAR